MALFIFRTVGVRFDLLGESFPTRMSPKVMIVRFAFIAASSCARPCDLLGREHRSLPADAQRALDTDDGAAKARANGAAHRLLHRYLQERLATGGRRTERVGLAAAPLAPELGDAEPLAPSRS
jgi:hypothetical protein